MNIQLNHHDNSTTHPYAAEQKDLRSCISRHGPLPVNGIHFSRYAVYLHLIQLSVK